MLAGLELAYRGRQTVRLSRASRVEVVRYQQELLQSLVQSASREVPFYTELYQQHGVDPASVRSVEDLPRLPTVSRATLHLCSSEDLLAMGVDQASLLTKSSSGSTGMCVVARRTAGEQEIYDWTRHRLKALVHPEFYGRITWLGLEMGTQIQKDRLESHRQNLETARKRSDVRRDTWTTVECRQPIEAIRQQLVDSDPEVLLGYPGVLAHVAGQLTVEERSIVRPRLVVSCGEVLNPATRAFLSETYRAPVSSFYGSTECPWLGAECNDTGFFHLMDDAAIVEVVDDKGVPVAPGEKGRVLITALHSHAQPFIRYEIGDLAIQGPNPAGSLESCSCGVPLATLGELHGREIDYLSLPDGQKVHGYTLTLPLRHHAKFLQQYQVIQERSDLIRLLMVCKYEPSEEEISAIERLLSGNFPGVRFQIEQTRELKREASGKYRAVISRL